MPESLVINLISESSIPSHYLRGYYLHRLFLTLVSAIDVELGQVLQTQKYPAFTLSPLQIAFQASVSSSKNLKFFLPRQQLGTLAFKYDYDSSIPAGVHCWWRIALLDDDLFRAVGPRWTQITVRQPWYLGPAKLHITNFLPSKIPEWSHRCSYQQLYEQASETNCKFRFQLMTPAVFRQDHHDSPLPSRDAIFHSLRRTWNRYSGLVFAPNIVTPVVPRNFELRTVNISMGNNEQVIGCLGDLTFQIPETTDPLIIKRLNALKDFSCYGGIGHKTSLGMGIVHTTTETK